MGKETLKRSDGIPGDVWADAGNVAREWMIEQARRLGLNSGNSSLPPSSDPPAAVPMKSERTPSGRKRGGQPGHEKAERSLIPTGECDHVERIKPTHCRGCGAVLTGDDPDPKRKQVIDLPSRQTDRHRIPNAHVDVSVLRLRQRRIASGARAAGLVRAAGDRGRHAAGRDGPAEPADDR